MAHFGKRGDRQYYRKPETEKSVVREMDDRMTPADLYDAWDASGKSFHDFVDVLKKQGWSYGDTAVEYDDLFRILRAENRGAIARGEYPQQTPHPKPKMILEPRLVNRNAKGGTVRRKRQKRKGGGKVFYGYKKGGQV